VRAIRSKYSWKYLVGGVGGSGRLVGSRDALANMRRQESARMGSWETIAGVLGAPRSGSWGEIADVEGLGGD
jgi:hypothetical protein